MSLAKLREWKWPAINWYNGFSPAERIRGWQVQWWLIEAKVIPPHRHAACSICSSTNRVVYHSENYYDPWEPLFPACIKCHGAIHRRFRSPHLYERMVTDFSATGAEWFVGLELTGNFDLAAQLRRTYGEEIRWYPDLPVPTGCVFPMDQLHPLDVGASQNLITDER